MIGHIVISRVLENHPDFSYANNSNTLGFQKDQSSNPPKPRQYHSPGYQTQQPPASPSPI